MLDAWRTNAVRARHAALHDPPTVVEPSSHDPLLWRRLVAVMNELPDGKWIVLVLHDLSGHTDSDIARMLGCSPGTCRTQLHRARRAMRDTIERAGWAAA